jgi:hypothetical protein
VHKTKNKMLAKDLSSSSLYLDAVQDNKGNYHIHIANEISFETTVIDFADPFGEVILCYVDGTTFAGKDEEASVSASVGDIISFGPCKWKVLGKEGGAALLITDGIYLKGAYSNCGGDGDVWKTCPMRDYLNGEFLKNFTAEDKSRIVEKLVPSHGNKFYPDIANGSDSRDKVFVLSMTEVVRYFGDSGTLKRGDLPNELLSDEFNKNRIARDDSGNCDWWLRTVGAVPYFATFVNNSGYIDTEGVAMGDEKGIRPAMWVKGV